MQGACDISGDYIVDVILHQSPLKLLLQYLYWRVLDRKHTLKSISQYHSPVPLDHHVYPYIVHFMCQYNVITPKTLELLNHYTNSLTLSLQFIPFMDPLMKFRLLEYPVGNGCISNALLL